MRRNPERIAWVVLIAAFVTACVLAAGIPLGLRSYLLNAKDAQKTRMQVIEGTVLVQKANGGDPIGVTASGKPMELSEGDEVITDGTSWATLDLFDRSNIILYGNSQARLERLEAPRFGISKRPNEIVLYLTGGLMRAGVALPGERATKFQVVTPHTGIDLDEGSYRIEVNNEGTRLTVVRGQGTAGKEGAEKTIPQGKRTWVDLSGVPAEPVEAARNLIQNGDFSQGQTDWSSDTDAFDRSVKVPSVEIVDDGGRKAVRLVRREQDDGTHTEAWIEQKLDLDVRDFTRLAVSLDLKLAFQSLSGGGQVSSEFPIIVRLDYKDRWGNNQFWTHGFYYQNDAGFLIGTDAWERPLGEQIPRGVWYPYESGNLLELLGENRPAHLTGLKIYASGWNYESLVSEVQLIVE